MLRLCGQLGCHARPATAAPLYFCHLRYERRGGFTGHGSIRSARFGGCGAAADTCPGNFRGIRTDFGFAPTSPPQGVDQRSMSVQSLDDNADHATALALDGMCCDISCDSQIHAMCGPRIAAGSGACPASGLPAVESPPTRCSSLGVAPPPAARRRLEPVFQVAKSIGRQRHPKSQPQHANSTAAPWDLRDD